MLVNKVSGDDRSAGVSRLDARRAAEERVADRHPTLPQLLTEDRVLAVVRSDTIPDAPRLVEALHRGGMRIIELTMTSHDAIGCLRQVADTVGVEVGMGTVVTEDEARAAVDAGARFLVSPAVRPAVARIAQRAGVPVYLGALTATEVAHALDLGAAAVKIFPAGRLGPRYITDLLGPFPGLSLLPSGGVSHENAPEFLRARARAVCAGTSVVAPGAVADERYDEIAERAGSFVAALRLLEP